MATALGSAISASSARARRTASVTWWGASIRTRRLARNVWQREQEESLRLVSRLRDILEKYPAS